MELVHKMGCLLYTKAIIKCVLYTFTTDTDRQNYSIIAQLSISQFSKDQAAWVQVIDTDPCVKGGGGGGVN